MRSAGLGSGVFAMLVTGIVACAVDPTTEVMPQAQDLAVARPDDEATAARPADAVALTRGCAHGVLCDAPGARATRCHPGGGSLAAAEAACLSDPSALGCPPR